MIPTLIDQRFQPNSEDLVVRQMDTYLKLMADLGGLEWSFNLVLVEDEAMADLNSQFRGKDGVTDVLSFSYLLETGQGPCSLKSGQRGAFQDLWIDPMAMADTDADGLQIGEVILAPAFVASRCEERLWSVEDEFPLLVVHGGLHLLGWDHRDEAETRAMQDIELKYLANCGLGHPLRNEERPNG